MNPFTKFLQQWWGQTSFDAFIDHWDQLEEMVVQVYRGQVTLAEAAVIFQQVWPWLQQHYPQWQRDLQPFWQRTQAAGQPTQSDPFQLLLALEHPEQIEENWRVMQHLPAAREALNQFILYQSEQGENR